MSVDTGATVGRIQSKGRTARQRRVPQWVVRNIRAAPSSNRQSNCHPVKAHLNAIRDAPTRQAGEATARDVIAEGGMVEQGEKSCLKLVHATLIRDSPC